MATVSEDGFAVCCTTEQGSREMAWHGPSMLRTSVRRKLLIILVRECQYEAGKTVLLIQHTLAYFLFLFLNKNRPRFSHTCWASSQGSPLFSPLSLILGLLSPIYEP